MMIREQKIELDKSFPLSIGKVQIIGQQCDKNLFHWHKCWEITCILSGTGIYYSGGNAFKVSTGDLLLFSGMEPHAWETLGKKDMLALVTVFSPGLIADSLNPPDSRYLLPFFKEGSGFKNRLPHADNTVQQIIRLLKLVDREYAQKQTGYQTMIKTLILQIYTLLARCLLIQQTPGSAKIEKKVERIALALEYISSHYDMDISLRDTAKTAYMSPNYFSAYFKETTGQTFIEYLTALRIWHASRLLKNTDQTILDIASQCGYTNMSNFYRMYKKFTGEKPTDMRDGASCGNAGGKAPPFIDKCD